MKKMMERRTRRTLLKRSSLGFAGVLGASGAASLAGTLLEQPAARAAEADPVIGVWDATGNLQALGLPSIPGLPSVINGQMAFYASGIVVSDSDADALPPLGGPASMGTWKQTSDGQYAFSLQRNLLPGPGGKVTGKLEVQGTFTLNGDAFTGKVVMKLPQVVASIPYTIEGKRFVSEA